MPERNVRADCHVILKLQSRLIKESRNAEYVSICPLCN